MAVDFSQFNKNPFESIINSAKQSSQPMPQGAPQGQSQPQQGKPQAGGPQMMKTPPNQLDYGAVGGTTPALASALQAMQKFIAETQDPTEISLGRSIMSLIAKLITNDQQKQTQQLPQGSQGQTPQGQPAGQ